MTDETPMFRGGAPLHVGQLNMPAADAFREAFAGIFERRFYANHGPLEQRLDEALAERLGVRHAISMVNATAALMLALRALGRTGEVLVPAFTFPATVQAVVWAGMTPVFCDVDPDTHTLSAAGVASRIGPATAAILGVHVWGRGCDPVALEALARRRGVGLLFDSAHAIGCSAGSRLIGGFGDAEVFSFHATKILNGAEGGCVTTNDDGLAARLRTMRSFHDGPGRLPDSGLPRLNAKMSEAQAAMALLGLGDLDALIERNRRLYELYRRHLAGMPGIRFLDHAAGERSNYQFIVIELCPDEARLSRDALLEILRTGGILARRYFFPGLHRTPPFGDGTAAALPVTDRLCGTLIQLPSGQGMGAEEVEAVCAAIRRALAGAGR